MTGTAPIKAEENIIKCSCTSCDNYIDFMDFEDGVVDLVIYPKGMEKKKAVSIVLGVDQLRALRDKINLALDNAYKYTAQFNKKGIS